MGSAEQHVAVVGAGIVGCAVAFELARRGGAPLLLEAGPRLGLGASAANSGILHTGFDSHPGELETRMILRAAELRPAAQEVLGAPLRRCGATMRAADPGQRAAIERLAANAAANGVAVEHRGEDELRIPGEAVTDPLALLHGLAGAAVAAGASLRLDAPVERAFPAERSGDAGPGVALELGGGERVLARQVVNCAGLGAGRLAGDGFEVYPRKGEFLVFEQSPGAELDRILLPVPSPAGKGVLVFPTVDGHVIAGPTARDRADAGDWTVEPDAGALILAKARAMLPALEGAEPIAAYAGLRPAGRGFNYLIAPSPTVPGLVNVAGIRSTGLTAAAGIAEHVAVLLASLPGTVLGPAAGTPAEPWPALAPRPPATLARRPRHAGAAPPATPWWRVAAGRSATQAGPPGRT